MDNYKNKEDILKMVQSGTISPEVGVTLLQQIKENYTLIKDEVVINKKIHIPFEYRFYNPSLPTVILFPGIIMRLDSWAFLYEHPWIKNKYNILSFEHRGQWHATKYFNPHDVYTIEENSSYVYEIIRKLNLEKTKLHLVAISSGCLMSFDFAIKYPHLVHSTLFFGPVFVTNYTYQSKQRAVVFALKNISDMYFDEILDTFYFDYYSESFIVRNKDALTFFRKNVKNLCKEIPEMMLSIAKIVEAGLEYLNSIKPRMDEFKKLPFAKRIIVGEKDILCSPMLLSDIAHYLNADIEVVKNTGHILLLEDDVYFLKKIENFITDIYAKNRARRTAAREHVYIPAKIILDQNGIQYQIEGHIINQQIGEIVGFCFEIEKDDNIKIDLDLNAIIDTVSIITLDRPTHKSLQGKIKWFNLRVLYITMGIELFS